jgi:hypothetical protein
MPGLSGILAARFLLISLAYRGGSVLFLAPAGPAQRLSPPRFRASRFSDTVAQFSPPTQRRHQSVARISQPR